MRALGSLTKIAVHDVAKRDDLVVALLDDLGEPLDLEEPEIGDAIDPDYEPEIDAWLIDYERGANGERADADTRERMVYLEDEYLDVDIDPGPGVVQQTGTMTTMRRLPEPSRSIKKFNRFSNAWE